MESKEKRLNSYEFSLLLNQLRYFLFSEIKIEANTNNPGFLLICLS